MTVGHGRVIRYYIVAQPVPVPPVATCRLSDAEKVQQVAAEEQIVSTFPRPAEVLRHRFERGHVCLAASSKGVFSGFLWFAHNYYEEDEVDCRFVLAEPKSSVWDYDVHVEPQFRLGRTFARLWDNANQYLAASGVRWSFSRISAFNRQSLLSHQRLGSRTLASLTFICVGPLQLAFMSCQPYITLSWSGVGRPTVKVGAEL